MKPVDWDAVRKAIHDIRQREAGSPEWDRARRQFADEVASSIGTVLYEDHDIRLIMGDDWRRLEALDKALKAAEVQP